MKKRQKCSLTEKQIDKLRKFGLDLTTITENQARELLFLNNYDEISGDILYGIYKLFQKHTEYRLELKQKRE